MDNGLSPDRLGTSHQHAAPIVPQSEPATTGPGPTPVAPATCSIIIPVHNKASLTRQCLDTILDQSEPSIEREIIVVDDGSTDFTPRLLREYEEQITVITNSPGKGFAGACNAGAAVSSGEHLIFLNNDTIPQPGWVSALVGYAQAHPAAAIVGAKLLYPDDTVQHAGVAIGYDRFPRHIYVGFPSSHPAVNKSRQFQAVTAACLLIRRAWWDELAGFDTGYRNGWEDVDLCLRARELGAEIHYCHESVIYHLESLSRDVRSPQETANRERYVARWQETIVPDDFQYYIADELIQITYQARYPVRMTVSPRLATWTAEAAQRVSDRILEERARQVTILLRNNIVLNTRVHEAELRAREAEQRALAAEQRLRDAGLESGDHAPAVAPVAPKPSDGIIGSVEHPGRRPEAVSTPDLPVSGWATSPYGILKIEASIDGDQTMALRHGLPRPDVAAGYPAYPDAGGSGFAGELSLAGLSAGEHVLLVRIHDKLGRFADARVTFQVGPGNDGQDGAAPVASAEGRVTNA
jgi:GT2 family glycosyltransferase